MMNECYCEDGTCDFCVAMLYAALLEERIDGLATQDDLDDYVRKEDFSSELEDTGVVMKNDLEDYVKQDDLQSEIDNTIKDLDLSDYVVKDDLEEAIGSVLEDTDIVSDVAAGAARGAMSNLERYALQSTTDELKTKIDGLDAQLGAFKLTNAADVVVQRLNTINTMETTTVWQRLRWLITGKLP